MDDPLLRSRHRRTLAQIHARAAEIHESSAQRLRATGPQAAAARVERFAATARDRIEHPAAIARLSAYAWRVRECARMSDALDQALDGAMAFLGADFGNLQLVGPRATALRIVAHRGFGDAFLDHFAVVDDAHLSCGRAAATRAQAVIADVEYDADFAPHRAIAAASGFRAVQSTPLVDRSGRLVGVLSTHFREPHRPAPYELRLTEVYADMVADALARRRSAA